MRSFFDCVPCAIRQVLDAVRMTTDDEAIHDRVLREALRMALEMDYSECPPMRAQRIHRMIRELSGAADPYYEVKRRYNKLAMGMYAAAKEAVAASDDPFGAAVRLAIGGNIIDFGVGSTVCEKAISETLEKAIDRPVDERALEELRESAGRAKEILYLGDNAGEIVFDRLLIEQLGPEKVTFVVKGGPILNDALYEDAEEVGLSEIVEVIDNGDDAPGTVLEQCSEEFRGRFARAEMVISKGQGNFETLTDESKNIFFLLQIKCEVLSRYLNYELGTMALMSPRMVAGLE